MDQNRTILVLGGTGNQGGASALQLLRRGWSVRALVRDPQNAAAQDLRRQGAELVQGDLNDADSVRRAMRGAYGVHSVQALTEDSAVEVRQGMLVADLVKEEGIQHLVYSSVGGAERNSGVEHFESKGEVEEYIRDRGLPATVLRPVFFMNNFSMFTQVEKDGKIVMSLPLSSTVPLQTIAAQDIGFFVAKALEEPTDYLSKSIEIAGDELTMADVAEAYQRATGVPTRYEQMPREQALEMFGGDDGLRMFDWFSESGYKADVAGLRSQYPTLLTMENFFEQESSKMPSSGTS